MSLEAPSLEWEDWDFCVQRLLEVSRSFSQPIALLPAALERPVTLGYLLCRIADTIEDTPSVSLKEKDAAFAALAAALRGPASLTALARLEAAPDVPAHELRLVAGTRRILGQFHLLPKVERDIISRWVEEMMGGMQEYCARAVATPRAGMADIADLERYCYFVAGTVGHMLTELFAGHLGDPELLLRLRPHAQAFGLGLQMVNILKDLREDLQRGICFVPRELTTRYAFEPEDILHPEGAQRALPALRLLLERAFQHLDTGFQYTLALPSTARGIRLFCLLPLWMAVETLNLAGTGEGLLDPRRQLKISREDVARIIADCGRWATSDSELLKSYSEMRARGPVS